MSSTILKKVRSEERGDDVAGKFWMNFSQMSVLYIQCCSLHGCRGTLLSPIS